MPKFFYFLMPLTTLHLAYADATPVQELAAIEVNAQATSVNDSFGKPMTVLADEQLRSKVAQSLGETLSSELGVSNQSFGSSVGTPVIRGQNSARVKVLQNSLGSNDASSLSPDHANGIEPLLAQRIEVLRGADTLLYGNGATGGVVNVIDNRIPETAFSHIISPAFEQRYDSVSEQTATVGKLEGSAGAFAYHLDGFYRDQTNTTIGGYAINEPAVRATDHSLDGIVLNNTRGFIANSAAQSQGGSLGASWLHDRGFIGVSINQLDKNYGIPADGSGGEPIKIALKQTKYDVKAQLNNPLAFIEKIKFKWGYTDYKHTELEDNIPATTFLNTAAESRLELTHKPWGNIKGIWGFQSVNSEFSALGEESIVPKTTNNTYGLFAVESLEKGAITYQAGLRAEWQNIKAEQYANKNYLPLSGSLSALLNIDKYQKINIALTHAQRAPQIQELYAQGVHEATRSYELGNSALNKELSTNIDIGYWWHSKIVNAQINLFHNWVNDYIYQARTGQVFDVNDERFISSCTANSRCVPVLANQQTDAIFKGFEAKVVFPFQVTKNSSIDLTLFSDYTRATFTHGGNVPRIPALRYGLQLDYENINWHHELRLSQTEAQQEVGDNDSMSPAYLLVNLQTQYTVANFAHAELVVFAKGKNLLNENIRNATSYLRNFAPEAGRGAEIGFRLSY